MTISIKSSAGGFRKWSEAQEPKRIGEARPEAAEGGVIAAPNLDQEVMIPDERPHRPWLVPGAGRL
jgi:hypothetical protein